MIVPKFFHKIEDEFPLIAELIEEIGSAREELQRELPYDFWEIVKYP